MQLTFLQLPDNSDPLKFPSTAPKYLMEEIEVDIETGDGSTGGGTGAEHLHVLKQIVRIIDPVPVYAEGVFTVGGVVSISSCALPTGAATESTLSTLNGKITACNTGAVVISSSALPTGASTEATLSTLNGKITACNTGAVVISSSALPSGASTEATLSTLNGKVTACNTGAVVISSGTVTVSNSFALDATLTGGTQKAIARGGAKGATAAADITSTAEGADHQAGDVQIYHGGVAINPASIRALTSADVVTVNNSFALDATLTGGTTKAIARGGAKGATTAADITSTAQGADHQAGDVQIYHGGVAVNPATIRALTSSDVVTAAQGTAAAVAGAWPVKVTDGTNTLPTMDTIGRAGFVKQTDGTNSVTFKAASTAAVAADTAQVVALSPNSPVVFPNNSPRVIGVSGSLGITTAATWDERANWAVPASKLYKPKSVRCSVTTAGTRTLILAGKKVATFNPGTNTFASVATLTSPDFYDRLFYKIATTHSATATTVTLTYTNQVATGGKSTGGLVIPSAAVAGDWYEFILATDDFGVQAVTAASDTANPTSVVDEIWGCRTLFDSLGPATTLEMAQMGEGFGVDSTESIIILFLAAATTAQQRLAQVIGELVAA